LLIYLQRDMQQNVFQIFHYALNSERYLFLGNSESAEMAHELFRPLDKSQRLYQARPWRGGHPEVPTMPLIVRDPLHRRFGGQKADGQQRVREEIVNSASGWHIESLEASAPASVLIDETYHVIHLSETAGRYLQLPRGTITSNLVKLVRPELQFELHTALFQASENHKSVVTRPVAVQFNGMPHQVIIGVRPVAFQQPSAAENVAEGNERMMLVFFFEDEITDATALQPPNVPRESTGEGQSETLINQLEGEVQRLRERLQAITEEFESANEEMKAANEELQSINEEYRSTTEELETSKEELQSVNEELQTVNAELKNKLEEISQAHSDMENLMAATDIATLFLDRKLRIQRYTPATTELFNILPSDRGRPINHLTHKLDYENLAHDANQVLENLIPIEIEVQSVNGDWLLGRLRPYRTTDHRIEGIVLTLINITGRKEAEEALRQREQELTRLNESLEEMVNQRTEELNQEKEYSQMITNTVREGLLVLEPDLRIEYANDSFYQMFQVSEEETVGRLIYELGDGQWDIAGLRTLLEEILPQRSEFTGYRVEHEFENMGHRTMMLNARRLQHAPRILLAIEEVGGD
jgi:two-component system CheB/CheR fusion protein